MSVYARFKSNQSEEVDGVWVNYGEFRVKVARAGGANTRYIQMADKKARARRRQGPMDLVQMQALNQELVTETCIKGWQTKDAKGGFRDGIEDPGTGDILPFELTNVRKVLKALPNLAQALVNEANSDDLFLVDDLKEEAGN